MQTQTEVTPIGREGLVKSDDVISISHLRKNVATLVDLYTVQQKAAENYSTTIKAVAEKCGLLPAVVKRFVRAKASADFRMHQIEAEQLSLVFEECSEN